MEIDDEHLKGSLIEITELCLLNAERLLVDSEKVSEPTKAALIELSLEEIAKGLGLYFLYFKGEVEKQDIKLSEESKQRLNEFLEKNKETINGLKISDMFSMHKEKLKFLGFLIEFLKVLPNIFLNETEFTKLSISQIVGPAFNSENFPDTSEELEKLDKILKMFNSQNISALQEIKENGFYVDIKNNNVIAPAANLYVNEIFFTIAKILIYFLKGIIKSVSS